MTQPRPALASRRPASSRSTGRAGASLLAPTAILMVFLTVIPIGSVLVRAVSSEGRRAFVDLTQSPRFLDTLSNTAIWTVVSVAGGMILGFAAALLLNMKQLRWVGTWRSLLLIPWIIPNVVGATIWTWNYSRDYGLLNHLLVSTGVLREPVGWLADPTVVLYALAVVQIWFTAPFMMLLMSAALAGIPEEHFEAAKIDGAGGLKIFRYIILPGVATTTGIAGLTLVVWALNSFTIIWVSTAGGPAGSSTILPILIYEAFQNGDSAMVSAVAIIQLAVSLVFALLYIRSVRTEDSK